MISDPGNEAETETGPATGAAEAVINETDLEVEGTGTGPVAIGGTKDEQGVVIGKIDPGAGEEKIAPGAGAKKTGPGAGARKTDPGAAAVKTGQGAGAGSGPRAGDVMVPGAEAPKRSGDDTEATAPPAALSGGSTETGAGSETGPGDLPPGPAMTRIETGRVKMEMIIIDEVFRLQCLCFVLFRVYCCSFTTSDFQYFQCSLNIDDNRIPNSLYPLHTGWPSLNLHHALPWKLKLKIPSFKPFLIVVNQPIFFLCNAILIVCP